MNTNASTPDVLVIGAGIAGLAAARELRRQDRTVVVLEKSRGLGGRAATRTIHGTRVDHGAQYLTVRDPRFQREVASWLADGTVVPWADGVVTWTASSGWHHPDPRAHPRYASPEGMSALGRRLAEGVEVVREARVQGVRVDGDAWCVGLADGGQRRARRLLITVPVPQALDLLGGVVLPEATRAALETVDYAPCYAVMAGYADATPPDWPGVRLTEHPDLAWVAHDSHKRREPNGTTLVFHATPEFSRRRWDDPPAEVIEALLQAASVVVPFAPRPTWTDHQRWRYAQTERHHPEAALRLADGLFMAGDGFGGEGSGRIEGAYLSGLAAARAILEEDQRGRD